VLHVVVRAKLRVGNILPYINAKKFASITVSIRARAKSSLSLGEAPKAATRTSFSGTLALQAK
jgi:hypothetical protein